MRARSAVRPSSLIPVAPEWRGGCRHGRARLLGTAVGVLVLIQGMAAGAAEPVVAADDGGDAIPEITVTARRRQESLQSVPVAVSVVDGAEAARDNLNDLQDIVSLVPSANFRTSSSNKDRTLFIRGLGTISTSPGVEPSVSTVIDGVVMARSGQATLDLVDLDHVEVLRGPQGTLFGKNASAGVINIVTAEPTSEVHGSVDAAYYQGDEYRVAATLSGPLAPSLTGLISVISGGYGGNVHNVATGDTVNGYSHNGFRSKLRWDGSDKMTVTLAVDYLNSRDTIPNGVFVSSNQVAYPTGVVNGNAALAASLAGSGVTPGTDNRGIANDFHSGSDDNNGGAAITVDWALGDYQLTSISAYRRWHNSQWQDYDQTSVLNAKLPQLQDRGDLNFNQFSQELRLASPKGHFIDYVTGLYYLHADDAEHYDRRISQLPAASVINNQGLANWGTTGNNYALFGEGNINFTDDFRAIAGARVVHDDLDYGFQRTSSSAAALTGIRAGYAGDGSTSATGYTDRVGLQYDISPRTNTYFTYSHGYKGPAYNVFFNMQATDARALNPETSNAYEIGVKSRLFANRLQVNLAAFIEDFDNYQANFSDTANGAVVTRLINAGAVSTKGVEGDITARPLDRLTLQGGFAWTQARIEDFNCPVGAAASCNVNGKPLPFAPDWKLNVRADYVIPLTDRYDLTVGSDYAWQSKVQYQLTQNPDTVQGAYGIWNANLVLADEAGKRQLRFLVKNLLDTHYSPYLATGNLGGVVRWVPRDDGRYVGVAVRQEF